MSLSAKSGQCSTSSGLIKSLAVENIGRVIPIQLFKKQSRPRNALATCTKSKGSYSCRCNSGFTGDGKKCDGTVFSYLNDDLHPRKIENRTAHCSSLN